MRAVKYTENNARDSENLLSVVQWRRSICICVKHYDIYLILSSFFSAKRLKCAKKTQEKQIDS